MTKLKKNMYTKYYLQKTVKYMHGSLTLSNRPKSQHDYPNSMQWLWSPANAL